MHEYILLLTCVIAVWLLMSSKDSWSTYKGDRPGKWFKILTSHFGDTVEDDNGVGAGGVDLFAFPYTRKINNRFGRREIYPIAMHTKDIGYYKYAILEIKNGKKRIFAQVVDQCGDGDCHENLRKAEQSGRKLIDIHETARTKIGAKGLTKMKARIISRKGGKRDNQMNSVLNADGRRGYVSKLWK